MIADALEILRDEELPHRAADRPGILSHDGEEAAEELGVELVDLVVGAEDPERQVDVLAHERVEAAVHHAARERRHGGDGGGGRERRAGRPAGRAVRGGGGGGARAPGGGGDFGGGGGAA